MQGFRLNSGHAYDAIIAQNRAEFENHPDWLAQVGGKRELRGDAKFCVSNAELRKFVVAWAGAQIKKSPEQDSISMDPGDGGGWCECEACAKLGSVSDRVVTLANEVAVAINALGLGAKYVGHYAYNQHCAPPRIHGQGARFYDAESGDCWGPCGLGYYVASRVMWDVREAGRVEAIVADFLEKVFGPAREPMREFYALINDDPQRRSPSDIVGRMYRHLAAARAATTDAKVLRRLDDLTLYTRHAELMYAHQNGGAPKDDVARHAYRIRKTMMVHSYGLWARLSPRCRRRRA